MSGYALAVAVSLHILALELAVVDAFQQGTANDIVDVATVVVLFGAVPAAIIGCIGAGLVHFLTRGAASQWPAVLLAAAAGLLVGLLVWRGDLLVAALLAAATAPGRLVVIPCARRRTV